MATRSRRSRPTRWRTTYRMARDPASPTQRVRRVRHRRRQGRADRGRRPMQQSADLRLLRQQGRTVRRGLRRARPGPPGPRQLRRHRPPRLRRTPIRHLRRRPSRHPTGLLVPPRALQRPGTPRRDLRERDPAGKAAPSSKRRQIDGSMGRNRNPRPRPIDRQRLGNTNPEFSATTAPDRNDDSPSSTPSPTTNRTRLTTQYRTHEPADAARPDRPASAPSAHPQPPHADPGAGSHAELAQRG